MKINKRKNQRIKISNIYDLKKVLKEENYNIEITANDFKKEFDIDDKTFNKLYKSLNNDFISYKVDDINDFINYIKNIMIFENEHYDLCKKISEIKTLHICRVEYERIPSNQDDVDHILELIEKTKEAVSSKINDEGKLKLEALENEIDRDYVYAKDIELFKRMILCNNENVKEEYDENIQTKILFINVPKEIGFDYVKAEKGSVEYHQHIKSYIPRMKRLIKNLDKYIIEENHNGVFKINQSSAIQDSVNIAVAIFNGKEFRAVSGKNDIENSCKLIPLGQEYFKSCKVNKLGKLGIGYNRVNDSEKKIIEAIHKLIETGRASDEGELILYSKWEPCPSCYYVINQFIEKYPEIKVNVKYGQKYNRN